MKKAYPAHTIFDESKGGNSYASIKLYCQNLYLQQR